MVEICPCPFCGYFARAQHRTAKTAGGYHYFVRCPRCHTEGPRSLSGEDDAIAKWNTRPTATAQKEKP